MSGFNFTYPASARAASMVQLVSKAGGRNRTCDLLITNQLPFFLPKLHFLSINCEVYLSNWLLSGGQS